MSIALETGGIHHLALRATNLGRSHAFYRHMLGLPIALEARGSFVALAGQTVVVIRGPEYAPLASGPFNPFRAGLDHVALACASEPELERVAAALDAARVPSGGLTFDPLLKRRYVAFTDPDGIAWQLYMAPEISTLER